MRRSSENIQQILARYFEGVVSDYERKVAEEYLLSHPEIMEEFAERMNLILNPLAEKEEHSFIPLKTAADYDDYQFMLLAAAAAEGDLSSEMLSDFNAVIDSRPEKKSVAGEFLHLKLKPQKERWKGKSKMLHKRPFDSSARKILLVSLSAAAILTAIVILGPAVTREEVNPVQPVSMLKSNNTVAESVKSESAVSVSVVTTQPFKKAAESYVAKNEVAPDPALLSQHDYLREEMPLAYTDEVILPRVSSDITPYLAKVKKARINPAPSKGNSDNWMINGITNVALAVAEERNIKDPVDVANRRIEGINKILGWDMQLKKELDKNGDLKAISFQSDLLCFSTPVKNK